MSMRNIVYIVGLVYELLVLQNENHKESNDGSEDASIEEFLEQFEHTKFRVLSTRSTHGHIGSFPDGTHVVDNIFHDFFIFM